MAFEDLDLTKEDFDKISTVGLNNRFFLNNDSNEELKQHYSHYDNFFNEEKFRLSYESKKNYCNNHNIEYKFYVVPDKSIVCKDDLPITPKFTKRNYDLISDLVPDFTEILTPDDYFKGDSHINFDGGMKIAAEIMHNIREEVSSDMYMEAIKENICKRKIYRKGDLYSFKYPREDKNELVNLYEFPLIETYNNDGKFISKPMPKVFSKVIKRESLYFQNNLSLTDKRCLIFRDSTFFRIMYPINVFFRSLFAYWDHWMFNKDLIEWYKPDIIMEFRTERFLDKMRYELVLP